jgi:hypothetical protein
MSEAGNNNCPPILAYKKGDGQSMRWFLHVYDGHLYRWVLWVNEVICPCAQFVCLLALDSSQAATHCIKGLQPS